jgi:cytochrome c biogenesis factor
VRYVANTSTSASPLRYRIAGLWGALEGSILLWEWLQGLFVLWSRAGGRARASSVRAGRPLRRPGLPGKMTAIASPFERLPSQR